MRFLVGSKGRISVWVVREVLRMLLILFAILYKSIGSRVLHFSKSTSRMPSTSSTARLLFKPPRRCFLGWNGGLGGAITSHLCWFTITKGSSFLSQGFSKVTLWVPYTSAVGSSLSSTKLRSFGRCIRNGIWTMAESLVVLSCC